MFLILIGGIYFFLHVGYSLLFYYFIILLFYYFIILLFYYFIYLIYLMFVPSIIILALLTCVDSVPGVFLASSVSIKTFGF
ncbi:hypothetical protein FPQ15_08265 [Gilliamella apicola]|uniref:Uncharacterized protein n=1 Tax=Gilliamella apicola TaxID=1196095 RepID=A0A556SBL5_9GAMM|nr:hypothetical protein FPQ15_08265 [Gilliamella apicola]